MYYPYNREDASLTSLPTLSVHRISSKLLSEADYLEQDRVHTQASPQLADPQMPN